MKRILLLFLLSVALISEGHTERKKIGLVLSGGGAKGMAHIGVLKVIQRAGIPIDYIAGTSIGSIVGSLYAIGYSANDIDSLVRAQDWAFLLSDKISRNNLFFSEKEGAEKYLLTVNIKGKDSFVPNGFVYGQNVHNLLCDLTVGYHNYEHFKDFPIPFACVATNIVNRGEVVFKGGDLISAVQSSMAIPGVFVPVVMDTLVLVDGGLINNFPVDVAKEMGADIIIGIDVQTELSKADGLNTFPDMLGQIVNILCLNKYEENRRITDLYIKPDISGYSAASFTSKAVDTLIRRGEEAGEAMWDQLMEIKKMIGVEEENGIRPVYVRQDSFYIGNIKMKGISEKDEKWISRILRHEEGSTVTIEDIRSAISVLYGTKAFKEITYRLTGGPVYDLEYNFIVNQSNTLNFGFRFDSEEMTALLLNTKINNIFFRGSNLSLTTRLSKSPFVALDYYIENPLFRRFNISYMFGYNDFNIYAKGDKQNTIVFRQHTGDIGYTSFPWKNFKLKLGLKYEYFDYGPSLYRDENYKSKGFVSYYGLAHLETYDRRYFPTRGILLKASYSLHTDNFVSYNNEPPFSALSADFGGVISLTNRFKMLPSIYGRVLIGHNIAFPYVNYIGGEADSRYMPQQLAFNGISYIEEAENTVIATKIAFRQRMGRKHYATFTGNYLLSRPRFFDLHESKGVFGVSAGYSYDFATGPVDVTFSYSNWSKDLIFYFNLGYYF